MNLDQEEPLAPDIEALLASERIIESQPEHVRRRAISQARAVIWGGSSGVKVGGGFSSWGLKVAVSAVVISTALSAAAIRARVKSRASVIDPQPVAQNRQTAVTRPAAPMTSILEQKDIQDQVAVAGAAKDEAPVHGIGAPAASPRTARERYALELEVLRPARSAVALRDFSSALPILAEHERRFPNGRLAEEREALRVQALSGMGRMEEAGRAAAAFRERFPGTDRIAGRGRLPTA
jgi:hypothetical protein